MTIEMADLDEELDNEVTRSEDASILAEVKSFPAPSDAAECRSCRLDTWLSMVSGLSRSRIQSLLKDGFVTTRNGSVPASRKVSAGELYTITIPPPKPAEIRPEEIPLDIVYEDDSILVINKQADLVVHPAVGHESGTLVNALLHHCPAVFSVGGETRPGIVHRLDKDTTGLLAVAKNDSAFQGLVDSFQHGKVHKIYAAICCGVPTPSTGHIESLIGRSSVDRKKMAVVTQNGRFASTDYEVERDFGSCALLRVRIHTGRTHQIRVHLKSIGCPIAGDRLYGNASQDSVLPFRPSRQMLHARVLRLPHPATHEILTFEAPPAPDFQTLLDALEHR
ncbi:MAG: RluA family pseudouridine synthase [Kiritimatiellia bacterium]